MLVDLDFRKPSVHKEMGVAKSQPGSAEALNARSLEFIPQITSHERLLVQRDRNNLHILGFADVKGDGFLTSEPIPEPSGIWLASAAGLCSLLQLLRKVRSK